MSRDTQFSAFARNVVEELTQVHDGAIQYSDYWKEQAEDIIAKRAYDLALHVLRNTMGKSDTLEEDRFTLAWLAPDMTSWPEETSNSKEQ